MNKSNAFNTMPPYSFFWSSPEEYWTFPDAQISKFIRTKILWTEFGCLRTIHFSSQLPTEMVVFLPWEGFLHPHTAPPPIRSLSPPFKVCKSFGILTQTTELWLPLYVALAVRIGVTMKRNTMFLCFEKCFRKEIKHCSQSTVTETSVTTP